MTLSTFAAVFGRQQEISIGIYCPQGAQQQTRGTLLLLSVDGTDRRTDERTDGRTDTHRPCSAYYAGSVKNGKCGNSRNVTSIGRNGMGKEMTSREWRSMGMMTDTSDAQRARPVGRSPQLSRRRNTRIVTILQFDTRCENRTLYPGSARPSVMRHLPAAAAVSVTDARRINNASVDVRMSESPPAIAHCVTRQRSRVIGSGVSHWGPPENRGGPQEGPQESIGELNIKCDAKFYVKLAAVAKQT